MRCCVDAHKLEAGIATVLKELSSAVAAGNVSQRMACLSTFGDIQGFYQNYWQLSVTRGYEAMLALLLEPADILIAAALDAESRLQLSAAESFARAAFRLKPEQSYELVLAAILRRRGDVGLARIVAEEFLRKQPGNQQAISELFMCEVAEYFWPQEHYDLLNLVHAAYHPRVYVEIGVAAGKSLALARKCCRTIGIDPVSAETGRLLYHSPENIPLLYQMTSDDFFSTQTEEHCHVSHFDLAFIDGLHHFDQVLKDFINLEKKAGPHSVVLIHDCLPVNPIVASRDATTAFWTGDVWKIIPCLREVRPDLDIVTLPLAPAGLALIRNLNPASQLLKRHYARIVDAFQDLSLPEAWPDRCRLLAVCENAADFNQKDFFSAGAWI